MTEPYSVIGPEVIADMIATAASTPPGAFVEVGVFRGGSAWHLAKLAEQRQCPLYLYDTFTGIPWRNAEKGDSHIPGDFNDTNIEDVRQLVPSAIIVPGVFPDSAIPMSGIAFAHLDCDQYRSVRDSLLYLIPRMVPGGIIWLDDSPVLTGAATAVAEVLGDDVSLSASGKHWRRF